MDSTCLGLNKSKPLSRNLQIIYLDRRKNMATLTISKKMTHGEELIVVSRREFEKLREQLVEVKDALAKIRRGERELRLGRTKMVKSLSDLKRQNVA